MSSIARKYNAEYKALADRSEKLYDLQETLKQDYSELDVKTGLSALSEELTKLVESG